MKKMMRSRFQSLLACGIGFLMLVLFTACAGVASTPGTTTGATTANTVTGRVVSVNAGQHSAILDANGQQVTVSGLTDQQVTTLQAQVGKTYTIQVTQSSGNSYTINPNSPLELNETNTLEANRTETTNPTGPSTALEPGSISFVGTIQSAAPTRIVVGMPNGQTLAMSTNSQTEFSDFNGALPNAGTLATVKAIANTDGSFIAQTIKPATPGDSDQNVIDYKGITTSAVGADSVLHFKVANQSYSFTIGPTANLGDFNNNARAIGTNQRVKVKVQFNGSTGAVLKVTNSND
ncbi:MAG: hypothetical protein PVS3B1_05780 [Ktedonobacteraceae bacterium]